eukprot:SM000016S01976  [mRNA]  locus=s16:987099:989960:+ [translate_table: standard]
MEVQSREALQRVCSASAELMSRGKAERIAAEDGCRQSGGPPGPKAGGPPDFGEFWRGALAGAFGETIMHPVDTLKTRIQTGGSRLPRGQLMEAFKAVQAVDGIKGLYRGVGPALTGSLVTGAFYFGFIDISREMLAGAHQPLIGPLSHFAAGATGETLSSLVFVPCEVVKQRMQLQGSHHGWEQATLTSLNKTYPYYRSTWHAFTTIARQEGIHGLFAGYFSTLARDVPFAGLQIMLYEVFKGLHARNEGYGRWLGSKSSLVEEFVIGGTAGGISAVVTTPLDVVKTRLQVQGSPPKYKGWLDAFATIGREEGVRGLLKGYQARLTWFVPASAFTFLALELLHKYSLGASPELESSKSHHPPSEKGLLSAKSSREGHMQRETPLGVELQHLVPRPQEKSPSL